MTIPPLELEWGVPPAWFVITLGGDLDAAVTEALDEGARRDPNVMEAYPQLHGMLQRYAADRQGDGAVVVLVRWGQTDDGGLFSAYASVDRLERDAGPVDGEVQERFDQLSEERADDRGAPTVEVFTTPVGRGVWREAVGELPAADGGGRTEIVELAVLHDIWLWVGDGPDVLRIGVTSFQLGLADQLRAELGLIVDALRAQLIYVGHPVAVEADREAVRQDDPGHRPGGRVGGREHDELAAVGGLVVAEAHQPAVVLGGVGVARDHRPLAGGVAVAEADHGLIAGLAVDADQVAAEGVVPLDVVVAHRGAVAPAVGTADQSLVDPRELEGLGRRAAPRARCRW